jgi:hypothetical protein
MPAILGLLDTETFANERFTNVRRMVFYQYPAGAAPLTGLLSLMKSEETDDPEFSWYEKRLERQWATATNISTTVVFYSAVTGLASTTYASGTGTWTTATGDISFAVGGTIYGLKLAAGEAEKFRPNHVFKMTVIVGGNETELQGIVVPNGVDGANDRIAFKPIKAVASVDYDAAHDGNLVFIIGSASYEAEHDNSTGRYVKPVKQYNYTNIHRTPFSISGTKLNTSVKYDDTGAYQDLAKEHSVKHMIELEKSFLFGERAEDTATGDQPRRTSGGVLFFLRQWELTVANPYGQSGATADTDDDKRIIENSTGIISEKSFDGYVERVFRVTNNTVNEKLVLCGSGFLSVINQLYRAKTQLTSDLPMQDTYGMDVVKHKSSFGTLYYKTHPLMSQHPVLRYNALILDIHNLVYRHVIGRDTELLTNRQDNDADYRKDEWLTECGLELRYPESCMYLQNVQDFN